MNKVLLSLSLHYSRRSGIIYKQINKYLVRQIMISAMKKNKIGQEEKGIPEWEGYYLSDGQERPLRDDTGVEGVRHEELAE